MPAPPKAIASLCQHARGKATAMLSVLLVLLGHVLLGVQAGAIREEVRDSLALDHLDALRDEISELLPRVQAGGRMAQYAACWHLARSTHPSCLSRPVFVFQRKALSRLLVVSSEPEARTARFGFCSRMPWCFHT